MNQKINTGLIVILLVLVAFLSYQSGKTKAVIQSLNETNKGINTEIQSLKKDIALKEEQLKTINGMLSSLEKDKFDLKQALAKEKADRVAEVEKLKQAPPEHLVNVVRRNLGSDEIWLVRDRVEFTLDPFRLATIRLMEWERFTLVERPNYEKQIAKAEEKDAAWAQKDLTHQAIEEGQRQVIADKDKIISNQSVIIARGTKLSFLTKAAYTGGGFAAGVLLSALLSALGK